ncbi:MAG: hypothetical protein HY901_36615 [Deltaproteobacteria bacterium]|nr:hypothetical protein [Deltaproteobacteria bacterium]
MKTCIGSALVAAAVLLAGCGSGIPLPDPDWEQHGGNAIVIGTGADDIWFPIRSCQDAPAFHHWDGGSWTKVVATGLQCAASSAIAGKGKLWLATGTRLVVMDSDGQLEDRGPATGLGGDASYTNVWARNGFAIIAAVKPAATPGGVATNLMLATDGATFREFPSPEPQSGITDFTVNGPDDAWAYDRSTPPPPSQGLGSASGPVEGPLHYSGGRWLPTRGPRLPVASGFDPGTAWVLGDTETDGTVLPLWHFDGSTWGWFGAPLPPLLEGEGTMSWMLTPAPGGFALLGTQTSTTVTDGVRSILNTTYAYRWTSDGWSDPEKVVERYAAACGDYVCGVRIDGVLEDGTRVFTHQASGEDSTLVTWKP